MAEETYLLEMVGIDKQFPGTHALDHVDFNLKKGEIHALIGQNGSGKSTLMNVLSGGLAMDSGHILRSGKPVRITSPISALDNGIAMIHQELKLFPDLSVAENIFYGRFPKKMGLIDWGKLYDMADEAIAMLSPDIRGRQKIRELSIAQQQLVEIVRALVKNTEVVIMDEPTASLTGEETLGLFQVIRRIRDSGVSIIFISHRLDEVLEISDRVTVLRDGVLIGTLERGQITGKDQLVDMMLSVKPAVLLEQEHKELGPVVLETRGLSLDKRLRDVSIQLHQGEVLGIAGLVGAGRTELLKTIFGAYTPEQGEILVRGKACHGLTPARAVKLGIAYLSEDRKGEGLLLKMSVEDNEIYACMERYSRLGILSVARRRKTVEEMRQKLRLKASGPGSLTGSLSGGIDLSVAPLISLSTVITASLVTNNGIPWGAAAVAAILACTLCGILNGSIITYIKIPPIIATLATTMAYQGICLLYTNGYGINLPTGNQLTALLGRGRLLGIPVAGLVMVAMYIIFFIVLKYTKTGRVTYGLGGNAEAVRLSGVSTARYSVQVYAISGLLAGVAGVMLTARLNSGHSYNGDGFDMDSIAAAVLGGVSVSGGTGSLWGTLLGVFILTMITNGLNMINLNTYIQMIIKGLIIVAAIGFGSIRTHKK